MLNDVVNPFEELTEGTQLKIIDGRFLTDIVKEIKAI